MSKRDFFIFGLILLVGFFILPGSSLSAELDDINLRELGKQARLPEKNVQDLIWSLIGVFHDKFEDLMTSSWYSPPYPTEEEMAVPSIMKKVVQVQALNHLLTDAPFQVSWGIVSNSIKIARLIGTQDVSTLVSELEKESVKKATEYGMNFLLENEIKTAPGAINFEYTSKKGNKKTALLQYIMVYKPAGGSKGEVLIRFYSPKPLEPPQNKGSSGGAELLYTELESDLPPFTVDIRGNVEDFKWVGKPSVDIDFPAEVPDLGIKPLGFWERNVLKPIIAKIKDVEVIITKVVGDEPPKIAKDLVGNLSGIANIIWDAIKSRMEQIPFGGAGVGQQVFELVPRSSAERAKVVQRVSLGTAQEQEIEEVGQEDNLEDFKEEAEEPDPAVLAELQRQIDEAARMVEALNLQVLGLLSEKEELENIDEYEEELDKWEEEDYAKEASQEICSVNVNTASQQELQKITGVGPVISQRIIDARPFSSLSELEPKVKGIGPITLQKIIDQGCAYAVGFIASGGSGAVYVAEAAEEENEEEETFMASVVINEIAWMGTTAATSDEWIELYNTTKNDVDLTGWKLVSADGSPDITFASGTISALGFYLLERTSSTTTDVTEDQIYTGALNNNPNCEVLTLYGQNSNEVDKTVCLGSGNWPAGDNSAKTTMERTDPRASGTNSNNWASNNQTTRNGLDADNHPINGTPRAQNSAYQTLAPAKVQDFVLDTQNSYSNKASLTWATSTDSDTLSENLSYKIYYSKAGELTESNLDAVSTATATTTQATTTISSLDYNSTYYFGIKAFDPENNFSDLATTTSYKTATLTTIASGFPSNLSSADVPHNGRNIVRTSTGNLYSVYDRSGSAHKVFLASSTDNGITWSEAEITSEGDQINPSIAVDSQNNLHIAWQGKVGTSTVYQIRYTKYDGSSFSTIEDFTADENKDQEIPVIAVNSQNKVHLAWVGIRTAGDSLYYVNNSSGSWGSIQTIKAGEFHSTFGKSLLTQFSFTPDLQNVLHFVWFENVPLAPKDRLRYRKVDPALSSADWSAFEELTTVSNQAQSSIAVDSQDNLHIVWHQPSSGSSIIKYLKCAGTCNVGNIQSLDEETNNLVVAHPSIATDSSDNIYVVWKRYTTKPLSQREFKNGAWQDVKGLIADFSSQGFPNLLWSKNNKPTTGYTFVFYEGTELKFYGSNDLTW